MCTRIIDCPRCLGEGGWFVPMGYDPRTGEQTGYWSRCGACKGTKTIEVEAVPVTLDDIEAEGG